MYFNGMRRQALKCYGWHENADGSWTIDVDGYTYHLFQEEDGLFVITTDTEQVDASYNFVDMLTDFWE